MQKLTLRRPDDFHVHFRDLTYLSRTVLDTARQFRRALVMPNLAPAVTQVREALAYRNRILSVLENGNDFEPLMTLYLTPDTSIEEIKAAADHPEIYAIKLYPAGATTHSGQGIGNLKNLYPVFEAMQEFKLPLAIHGEVTDPSIDIFDREATFIERELIGLHENFPALKIILEHITTKEAVDYISKESSTIAATVTAHHLLYDRNALFKGGLNPHFYCLPVLKRRVHQEALLKAATSGDPHFFLGTDSAPHARSRKESACGCAGIYTAHAAIELYAEVFEQADALDRLENFASRFGAEFYGLPLNTGQMTLVKEEWQVPEFLDFGNEQVKALRAGESLQWKLVELSEPKNSPPEEGCP